MIQYLKETIMLKCRSRFRRQCILIAAVTALGSCAENARTPELVSWQQLKRLERCWINEAGKLSAFLILSPSQEGFVPHFVSPRCVVVSTEDGSDVLDQLDAIKLDEDTGVLSRHSAIPGRILSNKVTHRGVPTPSDRVYYFIGTVVKSDNDLYRVTEVNAVINLQMVLADFMGVAPGQRIDLAVELDPQLR